MKDMKDKDKIQWNKSTKMFRIQASEAIVTGNISNFILFHFIFVRPPDSVRKPVTRWTRLTRWVGEFPTKHSARKIIPRSRTWTRWEYANTRSLFNKLGEIFRVLGTRSDLWNWLSKFSVLAESLCQGVIRFQKKITEKMRRVPLPYCTVGYWHPTEFKTIRY